MIIKFTIEGNPFGKQRPLVAHRHGVKRPETRVYERKARGTWNRVYNSKEFTGAVKIDLQAYYQIPKSWAKWKKEAAKLNLIRPIRKSKLKPDVDNVGKMIMDSLNPETFRRQKVGPGIYLDDGQVVQLNVESWYSEKPRVEVTVDAQEEPDIDEIKSKVKKLMKDKK